MTEITKESLTAVWGGQSSLCDDGVICERTFNIPDICKEFKLGGPNCPSPTVPPPVEQGGPG